MQTMDHIINIEIDKVSRRRRTKFMYALLPAAIVFTLFFLNPESDMMPVCLFHSITGYSCFTCGLTRSLSAAVHGHFFESFQYHVMGPVILVILILFFMKFFYESVTGREIEINLYSQYRKIIICMFLCIWAGFWLARFISEL